MTEHDQELRKVLLPIFREECTEHLGVLTTELLNIESAVSEGKPTPTEALNKAFRAAHSLKGASAAIMVMEFTDALHIAEEVLSTWRHGAAPTSGQIGALLQLADVVNTIVGQEFNGELSKVEQADITAAAQELQQASKGVEQEAEPVLASRADNPDRLQTALPSQVMPAPAAGLTTASGLDSESSLDVLPGPVAGDQPMPTHDSAGGVELPASAAVPAAATRSAAAAMSATEDAPISSASTTSRGSDSSRTIRVDAAKVDDIIDLCSAMKMARYRLTERALNFAELMSSINELTEAAPKLPPAETVSELHKIRGTLQNAMRHMQDDEHIISQLATSLDDTAKHLRMVPFETSITGLRRLVRDTSQALGKHVSLEVLGADVEIDRAVLEALRDPLNHLIRNAIDHGIEAPELRGDKATTGTITISVELSGGLVQVQVRDDGAGLDVAAIQARARELNLDPHIPAETLITLPGFSSRSEVSMISGRGVGLDVVKSQLEELGGTLEITSIAGAGTRWTMSTPLSLATIRALLVEAGGLTLAIPESNLVTLFHSDDLEFVGDGIMVPIYGQLVKVVDLLEVLGYPNSRDIDTAVRHKLVLIADGSQQLALRVDDFRAEREIVVKDLGDHLRGISTLLGITTLSDGTLCPIANNAAVLRRANSQVTPRLQRQAQIRQQAPRALVADDSLTTRTIVKSVLEHAGFEVTTTPSAIEGLAKLQAEEFDIVVSDIEMPRMDGFQFTSEIRAKPATQNLPVILVSSVDPKVATPKAAAVGADAFLPKGSFTDNSLVETARDLLGLES